MNAPWLTEARKHIGLKEVPGAGNNPTIIGWLTRLKAWWKEDLTPWCGTFVAHCLFSAEIAPPKAWYRAKAYLEWGIWIPAPIVGCVVVFDRKGGGHVGFVVGKDSRGRLMVLGGNQSDAVSIAPFELGRVAGYRWPPNRTVPTAYTLPILASNGASSTNEA